MEENLAELEGFSLESIIEALLFAATFRVSVNQLAETLHLPACEIEKALKNLDANYRQGSGIRLQWHASRAQLTTAPELAQLIEKFLGLEVTSRLSKAALETLSIIAYRQPVTRPAVDSIRGVNSEGVLRSLLSKGLIEEVGRSDSPGRPILYATTEDFLHYFGLTSLADLPPLMEDDEAEKKNGSTEGKVVGKPNGKPNGNSNGILKD